jgi:selenocysteine lyase/cysteine desulfurase
VTLGEQYGDKYDQQFSGRRLRLKCAMAAIRAYEYELSRSLLDILSEMPSTTIYGPQNARRLEERVPTFSFTLQDWHPRQVAKELDKSGIYVWDGNYYALAVTERLSLEETGGMVRVGAVHYNTLDEITQFGEALARIGEN